MVAFPFESTVDSMASQTTAPFQSMVVDAIHRVLVVSFKSIAFAGAYQAAGISFCTTFDFTIQLMAALAYEVVATLASAGIM